MSIRQTRIKALALVATLLFVALSVSPMMATASDVSPPAAWTTAGTRWERPLVGVADADADRFTHVWTERFLAEQGLEAYLNRPGLYDDGFNALSDDQKAALVVRLVEHWQETLPAFGKDVWTGDAAKDQATFEELATLLYLTIFEKDRFVNQLRTMASATPSLPDGPQDAGIPQFPGMSQDEITAHFDGVHDANRVPLPVPSPEPVAFSAHEPVDPPTVPEDPTSPLEQATVPALLDEILALIPQLNAQPATVANQLLDLVDAGTYLACGSVGNGPVRCAPARVPLGVPVALDLDGNALTGVGGAEVVVQLTPTVNPDFVPGGFAASLSVRRTQPSALPTTPALPAQAFVVYRIVQANVQIVAGFDARGDKLGDAQEVRVTLKDVAAALAGDVRLRTEITRSGPGTSLSLIAGYATVNAQSVPPSVKDPTTAVINLNPVPDATKVDLQFKSVGAQSIIEGVVEASRSPTVTATITVDKGSTHREMVGVIESLPTKLTFTITSEAVGATKLKYVANSGFPRFTLKDKLVQNTAVPTSFTTLDADVRGIPSSIEFTITRPFNVAYTASSRVTSAAMVVAKHDAQGLVQSLGGSAVSIPTSWSITGVTDPMALVYSADGTLGSLGATLYDRAQALSVAATATGIPKDLRIDADDGVAKFSATTPVSLVTATLSKRGLAATPPRGGGNHLSVAYVQASSGSDYVGASFQMSQVSFVEFKRTGASSFVDLRMGGGAAFTVLGDLNFLTGDRAYASATLSSLPTSIQATLGESTTITTDKNFDLYAYAQYGKYLPTLSTPTPPLVHGVSVRDGAYGSDRAIKASVYLTGLPTSVTIDPRNNHYSFQNWRPTTSTLVADAELDNYVTPAVDARLTLYGIPSPQSLTFKMKPEDLSGGAKRTTFDLTQSAPMGPLYADATFGVNAARVTISNIPDDVKATLTLENGKTTFAWDATAPISNVFAGFRVVPQSASFQGYVSLSELPSDFTLVLGRDAGGNGATLSYGANANTLDLSAYVDASLFGGDLKARLSFGATDLGASVNVYPSGTGIRFTSAPATGSLYASVWGTYNYYRAGSGTLDPGGFLEYPWAYHIGVNPNVNNLAVTLTGFTDFSLVWGVTSKLAGSYAQFTFGWSSMSVWLDLYGYFAIRVDWPWPFGESTIDLVNVHVHQTVPVNVLFHKYTNHEGYWFGTGGHVICDWSLWATVRPHPHGTEWNGASVTSGTAEGGAWYVTPNPYGWVPSWAVDLAARYTSPDGGSGPGLHFDYDC